MRKKKSLRSVMLAYVLFVVLCMLVFMVSFVVYQYHASKAHMLSTYGGLSTHLESQFSSAMSRIQKSVLEASYTSAIQACVFTTNSDEYFAFNNSAQKTIDLLCDRAYYVRSIFILAPNDRTFYNTGASIAGFRKTWGYYSTNPVPMKTASGFVVTKSDAEGDQLWFCSTIYNSRFGYFDTTQTAFCAALCNLDDLTNNLDISADYNSGIAITYRGNVISANREFSENERQIFPQTFAGMESVRAGQEEYISKVVDLSHEDWQLVFITPRSVILKQAISVFVNSAVILILFVFATAISIAAITAMTVKPVRRMLDEIRLLRETNWNSRLSDSTVSELSEIITGVNGTLDSLQDAYRQQNESREKLYQAVIEQNKAKLRAYRMQINPHFLFNTMECIRSMASTYAAEPVEEMINSLSHMFRYTFRSGEYVTLQEEIRHLENYIDVMNKRYQNRFTFRNRIDLSDIGKLKIGSMILQPLAENSIQHGFENKKKDCILVLQSEPQADGTLLIRFTDNGCGLSPQRLEAIRAGLAGPDEEGKKESIALSNVNRRLALMPMGRGGLTIQSKEGCFTSISFSILRYISGDTP